MPVVQVYFADGLYANLVMEANRQHINEGKLIQQACEKLIAELKEKK